METKVSKLAAVQILITEEMEGAILLVSLVGEESLSTTVAAFKTMEEKKFIWESGSSESNEEQCIQRL